MDVLSANAFAVMAAVVAGLVALVIGALWRRDAGGR